ncbi:MAG: ABC transporter permease [Thermodesulfovibrionales bacterium]
MFREFREIIRYRELLRNLVIKDIKVRYKRSVLGFLWVMLNPLLMMLVLNIVFSGLFKVSTKNYTAYLISGIILWSFFSQSTSTSIVSLVGNSNLIKKIYLPKAIFPFSVILSATIHFIFSLVPLFIIFLITGTSLSQNFYLIPVCVVMVMAFSYGLSLIISTLTVFFHDTMYIYDVLLLAWMYATPIFYPESIIPERFRVILNINPFYYFLSIFRTGLYMDVPAISEKVLYGFLYSIVTLLIGWLFYNTYKDRVVYYL